MPTKLAKPPGLQFHPVGTGWRFGDGTEMRAQSDGYFYLPDSHSHHLDALLQRGWRIWEPEKPKPCYGSEVERIAAESPLPLNEILAACKTADILVRVHGNKLEIRPLNGSGSVDPQLRAHMVRRYIELRDLLTRQNLVQWEEI